MIPSQRHRDKPKTWLNRETRKNRKKSINHKEHKGFTKDTKRVVIAAALSRNDVAPLVKNFVYFVVKN